MRCLCGCGTAVPSHVSGKRGRRRKGYVWGHNAKGRRNLIRPESQNERTLRDRARRMVEHDACAMRRIGGCKGEIEAHHVDKNWRNNSRRNVVAVCASHHRLLDNGRITLQSRQMPPFYVDGGGKRRYVKEIP